MSPHDRSPSRPLLAALCATGVLSSLWALFQWGELLVARAGGTPFCAIGGTFNCSAVWDSGFARSVHAYTHVPVAGWGLMWGIVAFVLPLVALVDVDAMKRRGLGSALRITALVGVVSVGGLVAASVAARAVCIGCIGTYTLTIGWATLAFLSTREAGFAQPGRGLVWAGCITAASYLALLYPGMQTPPTPASGKDAIARAAAGAGAHAHAHSPTDGARGPFDGPATGDPARDAALEHLMRQLPREGRQMFADLLGAFEITPTSKALPQARLVKGDPNAPVRIVDWTDPLCPFCAELHDVLDEIIKVAPGALSVQSHYFPLDGACNPSVERRSDAGAARCRAVHAFLCLENDPERSHRAHKAILGNQQGLTVDKIDKLLEPIIDKATLDACAASPATRQKLDHDIQTANANHLHGTPLVLLNGREVRPYGPLLYALTLTGGSTKHPAFASLPTPKPLPLHDHAH